MFLRWYAAEREEMREGRRIVTALIKAERRKKRHEKKRSRRWAIKNHALESVAHGENLGTSQ